MFNYQLLIKLSDFLSVKIIKMQTKIKYTLLSVMCCTQIHQSYNTVSVIHLLQWPDPYQYNISATEKCVWVVSVVISSVYGPLFHHISLTLLISMCIAYQFCTGCCRKLFFEGTSRKSFLQHLLLYYIEIYLQNTIQMRVRLQPLYEGWLKQKYVFTGSRNIIPASLKTTISGEINTSCWLQL